MELQQAIPSPSGAAMNPCGSMAKWVTIGNVYAFSMTRSADAVSTSPQPKRCSRKTFVVARGSPARSAGSWTRTASGSSAAATLKIAGSSSYSTLSSRSASSASSFVSAATAATGSPWYFVSPTAMTGRSESWGPKRGTGCGKSAAVMTSRTPGTCSAALVSMEMIRARAQSSVTSLTSSASWSRMSATYCWLPGTRPMPPTRLGSRRFDPFSSGGPRGGREDRLGDLLVARAAAQVACEALLDLRDGGMGVLRQEGVGRHELAGDAEAALDGALVEERLLERAQVPVDREPLDRHDLRPVGLDREHQAGIDDAAVQADGARTALAHEAAFLGARELQIVAQDVEQRVVDGHVKRPPAPVHGQLDQDRLDHLAHPWASRSIAVRSARAPRTRSIARRYSGLARIERGDGLASANIRSKIGAFASSAAAGSARTPLSSIMRTGRGPTLP